MVLFIIIRFKYYIYNIDNIKLYYDIKNKGINIYVLKLLKNYLKKKLFTLEYK